MDREKSTDVNKTTLQRHIFHPGKTMLQKYQNLVIGDENILHLITFELITGIFGNLRGGAGIWFRKKLYKRLLKAVGRDVVFGHSIDITRPRDIRIGHNCLIADYCELGVKGEGGGIEIGNNVTIGRGTLIRTRGGRVVIGDNSAIGAKCILVARGASLTIQKNHLMAAYCYLSTGSHYYDDKDVPINQQDIITEPVTVEEDVWIGARSSVAPGSIIRKGSVVGACSLVRGEVPPYHVVVGIPAKTLKIRGA
jgi:galactoside O-acetyltransferase